MRKKDAFNAKIVNTRLTKIFIAYFAPLKIEVFVRFDNAQWLWQFMKPELT